MRDPERPRVAILSLLFNWPSTGGGTVHTWELATALASAGYDVRHMYAAYEPWRIGVVAETLPFPSEPIAFDASSWNAASIQSRFRAAVAAWSPDCVIVTDSWNSKPLLAEAVGAFPYVLRLQAMECLCPLNNLRFLLESGGAVVQCDRQQLATPDECASCVHDRGWTSGRLHQQERLLSGFGSAAYDGTLRRAFRGAHCVLVVNPLHASMVRPFVRDVRVVTSGFDRNRFPWPSDDEPVAGRREGPARLFFAGLTGEFFKGFHVVRDACERLWARRHDFELVVTSDAAHPDAFIRPVGWLSQPDLARHLRTADIVVVPTIAQDALGRTAVEAMGAGKAVVASRIGGLPFTVTDGVTGLLFQPGDSEDLARAIEVLLDNPWLRSEMARAGRKRFEQDFTWDVIVERHYRPLILECVHASRAGAAR